MIIRCSITPRGLSRVSNPKCLQIIPASGSRLPAVVSGQKIAIAGTTNLGADDVILAIVYNNQTGMQVTSRDLAISPGSSLNNWKYVLDEPGLEPGNYFITLTCEAMNTTGTDTAFFSVRKEAGSTSPVGLPPVPVPTGEAPLPDWLDTLLILGILFVGGVVIYTLTKN